jgi:NADPH:quinone reductase-like Zn-dependent oxidoreductase
MHAAFIERLGGADAIEYGTLPVPRPGLKQILVRMDATTVDPVDLLIRSGAYRTALHFPFIIGRDLVGTVVATGGDVTQFSPNDRVWCNSLGYDGRQGAFAEYVSVDQDRLYPLPPNIDPRAAVAVLHPAATAFTGLVHHVDGVHPGQTIFVGGGGGNVGTALIQMAHTMGADVIATAQGEEDDAWCRRWGAKQVFDYHDRDLAAKVLLVVPAGVDVVWNTSGHYDLDLAVQLLAPGGCMVLMARPAQQPVFPVGPFYQRNLRAVGFVISNATVPQLAACARAINQLLSTGALAARIETVLPLTQAAEAHRLVETGQVRGRRVVLIPDAEEDCS